VSVKKKAAYVEERKLGTSKMLTMHHKPQVTITITRPDSNGKPQRMSKTIQGEKAAVM
jgi:hypothetical protein